MSDRRPPPPAAPGPDCRGSSFVGKRILHAIALAILVGGTVDASLAQGTPTPGWLRNPNDLAALGDATPGERFGETLALDGARLAVGAMASHDDSAQPTGHVRVFERTQSGWSVIARVQPPTPQAYAQFGAGLALDGATLAVGAPNLRRDGQYSAGEVSIHAFDGQGFALQQVLAAPPGAGLEYFGRSLALDGDTLVVAARHASSAAVPVAGVALVYRKIGGSWELRQTLGAMMPRAYDGFGLALHLEGNLLLIGAPGENLRGAAYAFVQEQGQWVLRQRFEAPPISTVDDFGSAIIGDEQRLLIGAPGFEQGPIGAVFEWRRDGDGWVAGRTLSLPGQTDLRQFGVCLARHSGRWVVGAMRGTDDSNPYRIELYGYVESGNELTLERQISLAYAHGGGHALRDIALDAQSVFVGLPGSQVAPWSESGEVRVFPLQTGTAEVSLNTGATAAGEYFGAGITANPQWLAIGAPHERRHSGRRGGVYIYPRGGGSPGTAPIPLSLPSLAQRDAFGGALAFSNDTLLVGAEGWEGSGSVHAFEHDGRAWRLIASWQPTADPFSRFGRRVDADAQAFVASSPREAGGRGAVYVVERSGGAWAMPIRLQPSEATLAEIFGVDVDLQGDTLAVSSQEFTIGDWMQPITSDGAAYVFSRTSTGWAQTARVKRPAASTSDAHFGAAVAVDGDALAVGAPLGGEVHVYRRSGGVWSWSQRIDGPPAEYGGFGKRLRFVAGDLWIAAPIPDVLFRYRAVGGTWRLVQRIAPGGGPFISGLGSDFAVEGDRVFAGGPYRVGHHPRVGYAGAVWVDEPLLFADHFEP